MTESKGSEPNEDVKARFREALERKSKASHHASGGGSGKGSPGAHAEHAAEANKREFRRKSGG